MKLGIIPSNGNGFFSNIRGTISAMYECDVKNITPYVDWGSSIYKDPKRGNNVWEYYFEQIGDSNTKEKVKVPQNREWKRESYARERMNSMIKKYVKIKQPILDKIDDFWTSNVNEDDNVLGVHLRMTDKFNCTSHGEPATGKPVNVDVYIDHIKKYMEKEGDNVKIFLATDSIDSIDKMVSTFGDKLFYREDVIRSTGSKSVHHDLKGNNYKKGIDVLIDSLLLSKCNFLFKGISNVALGALFFNENLEQFNLNQYHNKDMRESFIKQNLNYV
jgi:hypothetical protein